MTVTFLTTEDAQAINTQLSNLCLAIAELNRQLSLQEDYSIRMKNLDFQEKQIDQKIKRYEKMKEKKK